MNEEIVKSCKRVLFQLQLSNYDTNGKFLLECDSGFQMVMGRIRVMLSIDPTIEFHVMCPLPDQVITQPYDLNKDLLKRYPGKINFVRHHIVPNALATRYDFDFEGIAKLLFPTKEGQLPRRCWPSKILDKDQKVKYKHPGLPDYDGKFDVVYLNDPMHLRNFKALFYLKGSNTPKFVVHSHFIDDPACPKFPIEASLWMGQCEAARKADYNFWQCESSMNVFFEQMSKEYLPEEVDRVMQKSSPWDDGYSSEEILSPINYDNIRFDLREFERITEGKKIIFVPNRIGGKGRSSDYTNCGKFCFESLPELAKLRSQRSDGYELDYVVLCGNPSQKILNHELTSECGPYGYVSLVPDAFNRDEFKYIAKKADIAVGIYTNDSYGGTVARECLELDCIPFWADIYEYQTIAATAAWPKKYMCDADLSDVPQALSNLLTDVFENDDNIVQHTKRVKKVSQRRCSYECTTKTTMKLMGLIG